MHDTEDSDGTTVYYTILEGTDSIDENNVLSIDSQSILSDNVFYLSFDNNSDQLAIINDEIISEENEEVEEITLPDGTHAYLKSEIGKS